MRYSESTEENLRKEVEELKRQLMEQKALIDGPAGPAGPAHAGKIWHPSSITIWALFLGIIVLIVFAFFAGYVPLQKRMATIRADAQEQEQSLPRVEVIQVGRGSNNTELQLPGNIQAVTEAPILARADGYIAHRRRHRSIRRSPISSKAKRTKSLRALRRTDGKSSRQKESRLVRRTMFIRRNMPPRLRMDRRSRKLSAPLAATSLRPKLTWRG